MLNKNNPDFEIEEFWINFKKSMINFYDKFKCVRPIKFWSEQLNLLQNEKKYDIIELKIKNYISLYAIDVMKYSSDYHFRILQTNIKRWNLLALKYNFLQNNKKYTNIIFLLIDLFNIIYKTDEEYCKILYQQIELFILCEDFDSLIDFSINFKKPVIIDKMNQYCEIFKILNQKFNLELKHNICGRKILNLINSVKI